MITKELVDRINWLSRKQRSEGLTEEEKKEQHRLRQQYLQGIRSQVTEALDSMGLKPKKNHQKKCSCDTCRSDNEVIH
ncbi:MAG: DUF896 domain-containing protein [Bacillota bacterium]